MNLTEYRIIQNLTLKKLLDGTFTDKVIQIGAAGGQVLRLGVAATDAGTLGTYQINSVMNPELNLLLKHQQWLL